MLSGYQAIVLHRSPALYFRSNFIVFISTVGFSNEDNCCQSEGIGKSIKKMLWKVFWEFIDLLMSLQIRPAFLRECFFGSFFSKIMPESWGCGLYTSAAYTQVFTVLASEIQSKTELDLDLLDGGCSKPRTGGEGTHVWKDLGYWSFPVQIKDSGLT